MSHWVLRAWFVIGVALLAVVVVNKLVQLDDRIDRLEVYIERLQHAVDVQP
jgi:division protein CdvB (Snf7/Vps24/ESCRT-III family)